MENVNEISTFINENAWKLNVLFIIIIIILYRKISSILLFSSTISDVQRRVAPRRV